MHLPKESGFLQTNYQENTHPNIFFKSTKKAGSSTKPAPKEDIVRLK
jgi:hypothetical protein